MHGGTEGVLPCFHFLMFDSIPAMSKEQWSIEKMKYLEKPHSERNYTAPWKWWSDMSHCGGWNMLITISCFNLEISEMWYDLIQDIQENIYI